MKHKLSGIINTDCYVQFDTNEQLREWVKKAGIETYGTPEYSERGVFAMFPVVENRVLVCADPVFMNDPIHHHTNIEI